MLRNGSPRCFARHKEKSQFAENVAGKSWFPSAHYPIRFHDGPRRIRNCVHEFAIRNPAIQPTPPRIAN
jgi:hypothetical protein